MKLGDPVVVIEPSSRWYGLEGDLAGGEPDGRCVVWLQAQDVRITCTPFQIELAGLPLAKDAHAQEALNDVF